MAKNNKVTPRVLENPKRGIAKARRNKGQHYLKTKGIDEVTHCQSKDPFFKVKGQERHNLTK